MLQRTPVITYLTAQMLGSGLQPDMHLLQKVLWDTAEGVSFVNGRVKRRPPSALMFSAGADPIRGLGQQLDSDGVRWVWAASGGDVVRWYGPSVDSIIADAEWTEDSGVLYPASFWDLVPYGDWTILNNGHGQPKVYKPDLDTVTALGDVPEDVVTIGKKLDFLIAIGYGAAKTRIGWSSSDDIETWTAAEDNEAGALTVAEFNTPIRAACVMGDSIAVYSEDQMAQLNFIGQPFWFGYKFRLDGFGAIGKMAVCGDGRVNVGVGRNGVWWTDGLSYKYIDEGLIRNYFQDNVNWDQGAKIVAARNDVTGCYDFAFPMRDSLVINEAWSFDPRIGSWYEVPVFSLKDERRIFRKPLLGSNDGSVYLDMDDVDGDPLSLKTKPMLAQLQSEGGMTDVHNNLQVTEVDIWLKEATGVQFRVGSQQEPEAEFRYTPWIAAEVGARTYKVPRGLPAGVYHKLEFQSILSNWALDLQGFMLFGNLEGTKRRAAP